MLNVVEASTGKEFEWTSDEFYRKTGVRIDEDFMNPAFISHVYDTPVGRYVITEVRRD